MVRPKREHVLELTRGLICVLRGTGMYESFAAEDCAMTGFPVETKKLFLSFPSRSRLCISVLCTSFNFVCNCGVHYLTDIQIDITNITELGSSQSMEIQRKLRAQALKSRIEAGVCSPGFSLRIAPPTASKFALCAELRPPEAESWCSR